MTVKYLAVGSAAVFGLTIALTNISSAATLTNRDDKDHKVTVIEGDKKTDFTVKPAEVLKDICEKGCIIRLDDIEDEEQDYELEGTETVSIEEGSLYYEDVAETAPTPAAPAAAPTAPAAPPAAPATPAPTQPPQAPPAPKK